MIRLNPDAEESEGDKVVRDRASSTAGSGMVSKRYGGGFVSAAKMGGYLTIILNDG